MIAMTATFKVVKFEKRTLAFRRHMGPYMGNIELFADLFNDVKKFILHLGLDPDASELIAIHHDDPNFVPLEKQRISVGLTVPEGTRGNDDIKVLVIPAGKYVIGSFEIEADEYTEAWETMFEHLKEYQLRPSNGLMYESFKRIPNPLNRGRQQVDICVAIK